VLTLLVQTPEMGALQQLIDDLPAFGTAAERLGCVVVLIDERGHVTKIPEGERSP
jgi:hypothetical protein